MAAFVLLLMLSMTFGAWAAPGKREILLVGERDRAALVRLLESLISDLIPDARMVAAGRLQDIDDLHRLLTVPSRSIHAVNLALSYLFESSETTRPDGAFARAMRQVREAADDEKKLTVCLVPAGCKLPVSNAFHGYLSTEVVIGSKLRRQHGTSNFQSAVDPAAAKQLPKTLHFGFLQENRDDELQAMSAFMLDFIFLASHFDVMSRLNAWVLANRKLIVRRPTGLLTYAQKDGSRFVIKQGFAQLLLESQTALARREFSIALSGREAKESRMFVNSLMRHINEDLPLAKKEMQWLGLDEANVLEWSERTMRTILESGGGKSADPIHRGTR